MAAPSYGGPEPQVTLPECNFLVTYYSWDKIKNANTADSSSSTIYNKKY